MSLEFLGSKRRLLAFLTEQIGKYSTHDQHFIDLFCGTASVSSAFRARGMRVTANDHLSLCSTMAEARLLNCGAPGFNGLIGAGELSTTDSTTPYERVLAQLGALDPKRGFIYRSYSPASMEREGISRMYFTEENAARIDAIRLQIQTWDPLLTRGEQSLLVADLVRAASACSNTAGTYGCFLKQWKARAMQPLTLTPSAGLSERGCDHAVHRGEAESLAGQLEADVIYADPPYTKRQYAAYYHVLETITRYDDPQLTGKTGLRQWTVASSDFCYRSKAPAALERLIRRVRASHFFLSYSSDGQMSDTAIREILKPHGSLRVAEVPYQRYRSSRLAHRSTALSERLYHLALG